MSRRTQFQLLGELLRERRSMVTNENTCSSSRWQPVRTQAPALYGNQCLHVPAFDGKQCVYAFQLLSLKFKAATVTATVVVAVGKQVCE
jgi:hypothetical protein